MKKTKSRHRVIHRMPQVAILLDSSHESTRGRLRGIMNYVRLYGPWGLHVITGGMEEQRLPTLKHWKATGIIARVTSERIARAVVAADLPTVLFDPLEPLLRPRHPLSHCCQCSCDNKTVGRLAAEHFLEQNFEHYAVVPHNKNTNWSFVRFNSFIERLAQAEKTVTFYKVPQEHAADWGLELRRMIHWLRRLPKPAAIFAPHDLRGRQVLDACQIAGIRVPHQVAVLGVDNDEQVCEMATPTLSSIAVDWEAGGFAAAEMLDGLMRGTLRGRREFYYPAKGVVQRASTELILFDDPVVLQAKEFIRINSGFSIRVSDVVKHLKLSKRTVELRFKSAIGHSVLEEIQKVRMESVQKLVANTDMPFGQIASLCGLESVGHLGEIFKTEFGSTMTDYRERTALKN